MEEGKENENTLEYLEKYQIKKIEYDNQGISLLQTILLKAFSHQRTLFKD
jgi:hypothetical protein